MENEFLKEFLQKFNNETYSYFEIRNGIVFCREYSTGLDI